MSVICRRPTRGSWDGGRTGTEPYRASLPRSRPSRSVTAYRHITSSQGCLPQGCLLAVQTYLRHGKIGSDSAGKTGAYVLAPRVVSRHRIPPVAPVQNHQGPRSSTQGSKTGVTTPSNVLFHLIPSQPTTAQPSPCLAGQSKHRGCPTCRVQNIFLSPSLHQTVKSNPTAHAPTVHLTSQRPHRTARCRGKHLPNKVARWGRWLRGSCDGAQLRDRHETVGTRQV